MTARRTEVAIVWQSKDITASIAENLIGITYADNLSGAADDLEFELEDRGALWSGDWVPTRGDTVVARIRATPWISSVSSLRLGTFSHDKITLSRGTDGSRVKLGCVSAPLATGLRRRKRTRGWNGVTLRQIAEDIATRAEVSLVWDGSAGRAYRRVEQQDKSDLEFLEELAKNVGRTVKVSEGKIVVADELALDKGTSIGTIDVRGGRVLSWSFDGDDSDRYGSCTITFTDPRSGKTVRGQYVDPANPDGQTLELRMPVESIGHATDIARGQLRAANRFANRGKLTVMGDPGLVAGVVITIANARSFDGRYIVTRAEHHPLGGYTVALDIRRTLEAY